MTLFSEDIVLAGESSLSERKLKRCGMEWFSSGKNTRGRRRERGSDFGVLLISFFLRETTGRDSLVTLTPLVSADLDKKDHSRPGMGSIGGWEGAQPG